MRHIIGSMTLEICRLLVELDRLFMSNLDGWLPITQTECELIRPKKIRNHTREAKMILSPENWPLESQIFCQLTKTGNLWNVCEVTLKAPHIHFTEIPGGIDITLPVIGGGYIMLPNEIGSPSSDVVASIIFKYRSQKNCVSK